MAKQEKGQQRLASLAAIASVGAAAVSEPTHNLMLRKRGGFDELYTPPYGIEPIIPYLSEGSTIWCPFDTDESEYTKVLREHGYTVICSHIWDEKDFFEYEPDNYDIIVSNPPYSIKDKIFERLYALNKPFAMLLPIATLEGVKRGAMFAEHGLEVLVLNKRINFLKERKSSSYFNTSYFCKGLLPNSLVFAEVKK